jgi:hypothetical protein
MSFLTKTLPRLGKALDRALSSNDPLDCPYERKLKGTKLPRFLGELFMRVFDSDGKVLPTPCVECIKSLREVFYLFYKYKLPYTTDQEQTVLQKFITTEEEVGATNIRLYLLKGQADATLTRCIPNIGTERTKVIRRARVLLHRVLSRFDHRDIVPRHGPGAVSTKEKLWAKYRWTHIPDRITNSYAIDEYFYVSPTHVVDALQEIQSLGSKETPAKVILVQKDSRGPRLISCEPSYLQWIQQGISRSLVKHVESHPLTGKLVNFTDQTPNRIGALWGSTAGRYATLDLNEASDRVSLGLVHLLFPEWFTTVLMDTRSQSTELPNGKVIQLNKFAPMGSALCFPILALTTWAILTAAAPDAYTRERILVYGDDVIVPTAFAENAIEQLEFFGLKVNRDKSCTNGFFRESCGMDAYKGIDVTPVRLRTVWSSEPSPDVFASWISYANSFYDRRYYHLYDQVVRMLSDTYPVIPNADMNLSCPSLVGSSVNRRPLRRRWNKALQKAEFRVLDVVACPLKKDINGWSMLLRFFTEGQRPPNVDLGAVVNHADAVQELVRAPFTVSSYTKRHSSLLKWCWR